MKQTKPIHILPRKGGWAIQREGATRASRVTPRKSEARMIAKELSDTKAPIFMHNLDGTISEVFTPSQSKKVSRTELTNRAKTRVHVVARENDWAVKQENKKMPAKTFNSKYEAIRYAHQMADNNNAPMVIHNEDGRINHVDIPPHYQSMAADLLHLR